MKIFKTAFLVLLLCITTAESAQARISFSGASHSGSSSTFKSGFSSQKSHAASADVPRNANHTAFGSFGAATSAPPSKTGAPSSALSRDMSATAANSNALKTLDARNQAATPAPTTGPGYATAAIPSISPVYTQVPMQHTVIVQRDSGFSASPFLWFMLGHSMASQDRERVVYEHPDYPAGSAAANQAIGDGNPASVAVAQIPKESFGAKLLRIVLWLAIFLAVAACVAYVISKRAARAAINNSHYSLGKV